MDSCGYPSLCMRFSIRGIPDHWRLKAQKGRDDVNRFKAAKEMLGEVNVKELGVTFVEFIELARLIRNKLGCRKYLLDQYLLRLLEMANSFSLFGFVGRWRRGGRAAPQAVPSGSSRGCRSR